MQNTELSCGWLSFTGEFFPCQPYDHLAIAEELCQVHKYSTMSALDRNYDDALLKRGWCKISLNVLRRKEWVIFWKGFLSEEQKTFLAPYFEDLFPVSNATKILWDKYQ